MYMYLSTDKVPGESRTPGHATGATSPRDSTVTRLTTIADSASARQLCLCSPSSLINARPSCRRWILAPQVADAPVMPSPPSVCRSAGVDSGMRDGKSNTSSVVEASPHAADSPVADLGPFIASFRHGTAVVHPRWAATGWTPHRMGNQTMPPDLDHLPVHLRWDAPTP
ncbi:hypothetical protein RJ55_04474 [Drechmeria coniospora]|nr:hypothetical protein RJ55_04474 [Drechmeria coniospora]